MLPRPLAGDHAPFYQGYVDCVPDGDVLAQLAAQRERMLALLARASEADGERRYAPGKWSVKRVVQHLADGERVFSYRALCFARGEQQALPGFDENLFAERDGSERRSLATIAAEFAAVRTATLALFAGFDAAAWQRRGIANGQPIAVRALPWITLGHELHHVAMLHERYGLARP